MSPGESCCASFAHSFEKLYQEISCYQSHEKDQLVPKAELTSKRDNKRLCLKAAGRLAISHSVGAPTSDKDRETAGTRNNGLAQRRSRDVEACCSPGALPREEHGWNYDCLFSPHSQKVHQRKTEKNCKV